MKTLLCSPAWRLVLEEFRPTGFRPHPPRDAAPLEIEILEELLRRGYVAPHLLGDGLKFTILTDKGRAALKAAALEVRGPSNHGFWWHRRHKGDPWRLIEVVDVSGGLVRLTTTPGLSGSFKSLVHSPEGLSGEWIEASQPTAVPVECGSR